MLIENNRTLSQDIYYKTLGLGMLSTALGYYHAFHHSTYNYTSLAIGLGLMGRAIYPVCDQISQKMEKVWKCIPFPLLVIGSTQLLTSIHTQQL